MTSFLINPYRFGAAVPWTPANITTALWLDASDSSTITTVSGAVSQWNDKSGNGRNATQGTVANRPALTSAGLNGLNVITFDGSDDWLGLANSIFSNQLAYSWYAVAARATTGTMALFMERIDNDDSMVALLPVTTTSILNRAGGTSASAIIEQTESASMPSNSAQVFASVQAATSGTAYRNGTSVATHTSTRASQTLRRLVIGGALANTTSTVPTQQWWNGYICEFVVALSTLSNANHQRIEGYLAHKWGLAGSLPAGHPYKSAAPTV